MGLGQVTCCGQWNDSRSDSARDVSLWRKAGSRSPTWRLQNCTMRKTCSRKPLSSLLGPRITHMEQPHNLGPRLTLQQSEDTLPQKTSSM